ncbi:MvhD10: methyl-viologen-reducing hydrogenase, delta subunit [Desulfosarcina variabilis str. Montpellier]|uniref:hydrogenase iron-sulfur subunit n=1 Tax=Desulfosarcina variabilis TaxID=2300 RepID=UPI003AFB5574
MGAGGSFRPKIIGFLCNWCCYGGADLCGVSRFQYPPYLRVIRVMCSGRVDLKFVLKAFLNGADGVFVGGCHLNDCHYNPEGNYDALIMSKICAKILSRVGINTDRFRLEWVSAGEGIRFAEIMNAFSKRVKELGPLGSSEGLAKEDLTFHLDAALKLVPYIKLVERERLRLPVRSESGVEAFLDSGDLDAIFEQTIGEKLAMSQILSLLHQNPMSTAEIAETLGLNPSDISRHINNSTKHGFVRYDVQQNCYAIA